MNTNTKAFHRHVVAVPLTLSLLLGVLGTTASGVASAIPVSQTRSFADGVFALEDGTVGRVADGGSLAIENDKPSLTDGSALVASRGIVWVRTGESAVLGFGGGVYLHRSADSLTVSALSTPAILRHQGFIAFIPQGRQLTLSITSLPTGPDHAYTLSLLDRLTGIDGDFYRSQLSDISALEEGTAAPAPSVTSRVLSAGTDVLDLLRLPAARERLSQEDLSRTTDRMAAFIAAGDTAGLHALLTDDQVIQYLATSPDATRALTGLLASAAQHPGMMLEILPFIADADLSLLASLHPSLRSAAWIGGRQGTGDSADAMILGLLLFPLSDTLAEPAPELVLRHWGDALASAIRSSEDPLLLTQELFAVLNRYVAVTSTLGYPDRLSNLLSEVNRVIAQSPDAVTEEQRIQILGWEQNVAPSLAEPVEAVVAPVESDDQDSGSGASLQEIMDAFTGNATNVTEAPLSESEAAEVAAAAKETFKAAGALFTVRTKIQGIGKDHVAVTDIVFSADNGDHFYSFEFQPSTGAMSSLTRDGDKMLFGMTLEKFGEWVKGE